VPLAGLKENTPPFEVQFRLPVEFAVSPRSTLQVEVVVKLVQFDPGVSTIGLTVNVGGVGLGDGVGDGVGEKVGEGVGDGKTVAVGVGDGELGVGCDDKDVAVAVGCAEVGGEAGCDATGDTCENMDI